MSDYYKEGMYVLAGAAALGIGYYLITEKPPTGGGNWPSVRGYEVRTYVQNTGGVCTGRVEIWDCTHPGNPHQVSETTAFLDQGTKNWEQMLLAWFNPGGALTGPVYTAIDAKDLVQFLAELKKEVSEALYLLVYKIDDCTAKNQYTDPYKTLGYGGFYDGLLGHVYDWQTDIFNHTVPKDGQTLEQWHTWAVARLETMMHEDGRHLPKEALQVVIDMIDMKNLRALVKADAPDYRQYMIQANHQWNVDARAALVKGLDNGDPSAVATFDAFTQKHPYFNKPFTWYPGGDYSCKDWGNPSSCVLNYSKGSITYKGNPEWLKEQLKQHGHTGQFSTPLYVLEYVFNSVPSEGGNVAAYTKSTSWKSARASWTALNSQLATFQFQNNDLWYFMSSRCMYLEDASVAALNSEMAKMSPAARCYFNDWSNKGKAPVAPKHNQ